MYSSKLDESRLTILQIDMVQKAEVDIADTVLGSREGSINDGLRRNDNRICAFSKLPEDCIDIPL